LERQTLNSNLAYKEKSTDTLHDGLPAIKDILSAAQVRGGADQIPPAVDCSASLRAAKYRPESELIRSSQLVSTLQRPPTLGRRLPPPDLAPKPAGTLLARPAARGGEVVSTDETPFKERLQFFKVHKPFPPNFAICSVVYPYPDPDWIRIQWGPWIHSPYGIPIWIRIKEGKMGKTNRKHSINIIF
jgi:hypothetical protein